MSVENLADDQDLNRRHLGFTVLYVTERSGPGALPHRDDCPLFRIKSSLFESSCKHGSVLVLPSVRADGFYSRGLVLCCH